MEEIRRALKRFLAVVESLECECDAYHGYTCTVHADRILAKAALNNLDAILTSRLTLTAKSHKSAKSLAAKQATTGNATQ